MYCFQLKTLRFVLAILTGSCAWGCTGVQWDNEEGVRFFMINFIDPVFKQVNSEIETITE